MKALITNDAVVLGILISVLALVFITEQNPRFKRFYTFVPALLLCYFIPSLLNISWFEGTEYGFRIISGEEKEGSKLYFMASRYLLPACLVLLTISTDLGTIRRLGSKAVIMFFAGTVGVILGGFISFALFRFISPDTVGGEGGDAVWRGLATIAGSWIGGGANQAAMKEVFEVGPSLFSAMIAVDVIVANIWMAFLLYGAGISDKIDKWLKADSSAIQEMKEKIEQYQQSVKRIPTVTDYISILAVGFGSTAVAHFFADILAPYIQTNAPELAHFSLTSSFFWIVIIATTLGLLLSFFPKIRALEGAGASKIGSVMIYILVATIGMQMNVLAIFSNIGLFFVGVVWMMIHALIMIVTAKIIKAPFFFMAVGSQANIGGAASAPIVASAFHPSLAPIGVLLAVLGYAVGTYGGWLCGIMMQSIAK